MGRHSNDIEHQAGCDRVSAPVLVDFLDDLRRGLVITQPMAMPLGTPPGGIVIDPEPSPPPPWRSWRAVFSR